VGKVYLVGAGPGDPKLITLKGLECLKRADVVIYDRLSSKALLSFTKPEAELIYVGKAGGVYRPFSQDYINKLTLDKVQEDKIVVRLKGGDPFVFGRGGEEAEFLKENGIPIEVVPGVSSAQGVPDYAGIPLTDRRFASTVALVTGHEDPTKFKTEVDWKKLATATKTIIIFMAIKNLAFIAGELIRHGRSKDTPVALIRWGTLPAQKTLVGTLKDIVEKAKKAQFKPPTIIVVGEVVKMRDKLSWFEEKPLFGRRILVTRAKEQASKLAEALEDLGAGVIEFPTIKTVPPKSFEKLDEAIAKIEAKDEGRKTRDQGQETKDQGRRAKKPASDLRPTTFQPGYDWIIFTSANGVKFFFDRLKALGKDIRCLHGIKLATVGPATSKRLEDAGLSPDYEPQEYRGEGLIAGFRNIDLKGARILIPRAEVAREILPEELSRLGADVTVAPAYRTVPADVPGEEIKKAIQEQKVDVITFTSGSTAKNFVKLLPGIDLKQALEKTLVACIGPIAAKTVESLGFKVDVIPEEYTVPSLVKSIVEAVHEKTTSRVE